MRQSEEGRVVLEIAATEENWDKEIHYRCRPPSDRCIPWDKSAGRRECWWKTANSSAFTFVK